MKGLSVFTTAELSSDEFSPIGTQKAHMNTVGARARGIVNGCHKVESALREKVVGDSTMIS